MNGYRNCWLVSKQLLWIVMLSLCLLTQGCSMHGRGQATKVADVRGERLGSRELVLEVSREKLLATINLDQVVNRIRLVPILRSSNSDSGAMPEYYLFDINPKGIYSLIGLKNRDVLVSAAGYLVSDPDQFVQYVGMLGNLPESVFEINRNGSPLIVRCKFTT